MLNVTSAQHLALVPVRDGVEDVPADGWHRISAGAGATGPRLYDWAFLPFRSMVPQGWSKGLLIRRSLGAEQKLTFYLTFAPAGTPLAELVRVAGSRWTIESCFETAKGELGLDQYQVRSWTGWYRHITLVMLALAFLTVVRKAAIGGSGSVRPDGQSPPFDHAGPAGQRQQNSLSALPTRPVQTTRTRRRYRLVALAKTASAAGSPRPLETTNSQR